MISKRLEKLTKNNSAIRAMFEEGNRMAKLYGRDNVYDFSLGNPSVEVPESFTNEVIKTLQVENPLLIHGYMPNAGYPDVREAVANDLNKKYKMNYVSTNIVMTVGAAGGLNCILQTLLNLKDEVLVCAPFFVEYKNYIENWGGKTIIVDSDENDFSLSPKNISASISPRTKAIIINNPNNPTGVVYSKENLKGVCEVLREKEKEYGHPIYLISDEPYRDIVYDDCLITFIPTIYNNTIVVYSWSKTLSLPGERIGYVAINPNAEDSELICRATAISNRIIGFVNAPSLVQFTIKNFLDYNPDLTIYNNNRVMLYEGLTKIGYKCIYPQGAFYLWMKIPCDEKLFIEEAKRLHLLLVPGSSFYTKGYVRIAYCVSPLIVQKSLSLFEKLWAIITD